MVAMTATGDSNNINNGNDSNGGDYNGNDSDDDGDKNGNQWQQ